MTKTEEELFERCLKLEGIRYEKEDLIEEMLDYLVKTNITLEEMINLEIMVYGEAYVPEINNNLKRALEVF